MRNEPQLIQPVLQEACTVYQAQVKDGEAWNYLTQTRGISQEMIERFRLGFAPNSRTFLTAQLTQTFSLDTLVSAGLTGIPSSNDEDLSREPYDRLRNVITFPVFDIGGKIVSFKGRKIDEVESSYGKYISCYPWRTPPRERALYGINFAREEIQKAGEIFLFEGAVDTILAHQNGLQNSVSLLGTGLTAEDIVFLYQKFGMIKVNVCYDYDVPGIKAAQKVKQMFDGSERIKAYVVKGQKTDPADIFTQGKSLKGNLIEI